MPIFFEDNKTLLSGIGLKLYFPISSLKKIPTVTFPTPLPRSLRFFNNSVLFFESMRIFLKLPFFKIAFDMSMSFVAVLKSYLV